ncbi:MAG: M16 family metallopeptidase, partial [Gemmatimonadaceae bacterium]
MSRLITRAVALSLVAQPLLAQAKLDRTVEPPPASPKAMHIPTWNTTTLANGAQLVVTPKRDVPLVSFSLTFVGGTSQFEPAGKTGVASLTTQMLREGTLTRTGDQLADALEMLGVGGLGSFIGSESGSVTFESTKAKFAPTLDVLADVLLHPSFPADALERLRGQMLVNLTQAKDQPNAIANNVFLHVVYGDAHPYG